MRGKKADDSAIIADLLSRDTLDLDEFDSFLATWKRLADQHAAQTEDATKTSSKIKEVESLAEKALNRLLEADPDGPTGGNALFKSLQIGAVICDASGHIRQSNDQALEAYGLHDRSEIGDAHLLTETGEPFGAPFLATLRDQSALTIRKCFKDDTAVNLAILLLESNSAGPQFLIVFMDTSWGPEAKGLLAQRFDLTDVETEIVGQFIAGVPLKQIAENRGRSYQTVRNQFQTVLEKTGCPNQADLLRLLLGTSYLFSQIQTLADAVISAPVPGRNIAMARPNGRFFDVQLFGDMNGEPFICLPSIFGLPITAAIDAKLRAQNLLMLGIARPGFGETSHPAAGQNLAECLAGDITALLDSMEIERCVFVGRASAAPMLFEVANRLPDRVTHAISVNGMVPRPYVDMQSVVSSWTKSLFSASRMSPTIAALILGAGNRLRLQMGTVRFFSKMYRRSAVDTAAVLNPDICQSLERGIQYVTDQGLRAGTQDMIGGFQDWRDTVKPLKMPITLLHGVDDPHVPINAVREFAEAFSDQIELIEFADGGGLLNYTHADQIFELIKTG